MRLDFKDLSTFFLSSPAHLGQTIISIILLILTDMFTGGIYLLVHAFYRKLVVSIKRDNLRNFLLLLVKNYKSPLKIWINVTNGFKFNQIKEGIPKTQDNLRELMFFSTTSSTSEIICSVEILSKIIGLKQKQYQYFVMHQNYVWTS